MGDFLIQPAKYRPKRLIRLFIDYSAQSVHSRTIFIHNRTAPCSQQQQDKCKTKALAEEFEDLVETCCLLRACCNLDRVVLGMIILSQDVRG
jgi:hypothetical protein